MNILFIAIDTLRADHLSYYGYKRKTSPFLDNLAERGALFKNFYAPGIPTQPSFTTVFTGLHAITHRVVGHGGKVELDDNLPYFTEQLQKKGYLTCAVDNLWKMKQYFNRGYEFYIDPSFRHQYMQKVTCDTQNSRAIPWIKEHKKDKFFLFVHYWDPHAPYTPPDNYLSTFYQGNPFDPSNHSLDNFYKYCPYRESVENWFKLYIRKETKKVKITDASFLEASYDGEIRYVDDGIKKLVETLETEKLLEDTLIIIFSDHGESLTEHRIYYDHHGLYENNIHVPLIMVGPNIAKGKIIEQLVQHIDLAPTILEAASCVVPKIMEGKSLWPLILGRKEKYYDKLITEESTRMCKWAILKNNYKLILSREQDIYGLPPRELYDLNKDPEEELNIAEDKREIADRLERELEDWVANSLKRNNQKIDPLKEQGAVLPFSKSFMHPKKYW